jgi:hypothetical protein
MMAQSSVDSRAATVKASTCFSRANEIGPRTVTCMIPTPMRAAANFTGYSSPAAEKGNWGAKTVLASSSAT